MSREVIGYAATFHDSILIDTVSGTERAAKVNWLVGYKHLLVTNYHSDESIDALFHRYAGKLIKVVVQPCDG